jgi:hypothetical protein
MATTPDIRVNALMLLYLQAGYSQSFVLFYLPFFDLVSWIYLAVKSCL